MYILRWVTVVPYSGAEHVCEIRADGQNGPGLLLEDR